MLPDQQRMLPDHHPCPPSHTQTQSKLAVVGPICAIGQMSGPPQDGTVQVYSKRYAKQELRRPIVDANSPPDNGIG